MPPAWHPTRAISKKKAGLIIQMAHDIIRMTGLSNHPPARGAQAASFTDVFISLRTGICFLGTMRKVGPRSRQTHLQA